LRDECLNVETFLDLSDVKEKLARWREDYNQVRPHSSLDDRSPEEFARKWKELSAASLRTAGPAKGSAGRRRAEQRCRGSKIFTAFRPVLGGEGRPEKLPLDSADKA